MNKNTTTLIVSVIIVIIAALWLLKMGPHNTDITNTTNNNYATSSVENTNTTSTAGTIRKPTAKPGTPTRPTAPTAGVRLGQKIVVNGVTILPKKVVEDSRCPTGAQCVWAGQVILETEVDGVSRRLTLGSPFTVGGTTVTLKTVTPYPAVKDTVLLEEYRFAFTVSKKLVATPPQGACYVGGCSGQVCSDQKDMASTCEYREVYSCYKDPAARCERQPTGQCGWTQTDALKICIAEKSKI